MKMFIFTVIVFFVSQLTSGSYSYEDCIERKFEPKACYQSEALYNAGKSLCDFQNKPFDGSSDCKVD
jgi:hypothetical protein